MDICGVRPRDAQDHALVEKQWHGVENSDPAQKGTNPCKQELDCVAQTSPTRGAQASSSPGPAADSRVLPSMGGACVLHLGVPGQRIHSTFSGLPTRTVVHIAPGAIGWRCLYLHMLFFGDPSRSPTGDHNSSATQSANVMMNRVVLLLRLAQARQSIWAVEQPITSLMPNLPRWQSLFADVKVPTLVTNIGMPSIM